MSVRTWWVRPMRTKPLGDDLIKEYQRALFRASLAESHSSPSKLGVSLSVAMDLVRSGFLRRIDPVAPGAGSTFVISDAGTAELRRMSEK